MSERTLRTSAQEIGSAYPAISVDPIAGDFERDLGALPSSGPRLVAFLGSTIGNLYPEQRARFLRTLGSELARRIRCCSASTWSRTPCACRPPTTTRGA